MNFQEFGERIVSLGFERGRCREGLENDVGETASCIVPEGEKISGHWLVVLRKKDI